MATTTSADVSHRAFYSFCRGESNSSTTQLTHSNKAAHNDGAQRRRKRARLSSNDRWRTRFDYDWGAQKFIQTLAQNEPSF